MPFQVGSIALHDDGQHLGSAKRDVADGLAGLGSGGELLAPGSDLELTRDGSENIEIVERTSGNIVFRWTRVGVNDFECRVNCGGVACIIQNDSMKDVANGIAGLDGSVEIPVALLKTNVANGIAGLDGSADVLLAQVPDVLTGKKTDLNAIAGFGSYTGDDTVNRAIPHGLGQTPSFVTIIASAGDVHAIGFLVSTGIARFIYPTASTVYTATAMDSTNFYIGNAVSFIGNQSAGTYFFKVIV